MIQPSSSKTYSPVSHLEIKSPEILNISKVKLIIVIAGSYNSEIETFIKKIILVNLELKKFEKIKIFITGGTGFLGSSLIKYLLQNMNYNFEITALTRNKK